MHQGTVLAMFFSHFPCDLILLIICFISRSKIGWFVSLRTFLIYQFSSVQSLSRVRLFETPWITARQASLSITNSIIMEESQWANGRGPWKVLEPRESRAIQRYLCLCPDLFHMLAKPNTQLYFYIDISVEEHPTSFQLWESFNSNPRREKKNSLMHSIWHLSLLARFWKLSCIVWVPSTPPAPQTKTVLFKNSRFFPNLPWKWSPRKSQPLIHFAC